VTAVLKKGDVTLVPRVERATSLFKRMKGLLGRSSLPADEALWLSPCSAVHTFGMRFALDLVFLDARTTVVRVVRGVRPWRIVFGGRRSRSAIELTAGSLPDDALAVGDRVQLV